MSCTTACHSPTPSQAHCGVCHASFANVTTFDDHRRAARSTGACPDPASLGLLEQDRVWGSPEYHAGADAKRARLADSAARARHQRHEPASVVHADVRAPEATTGALW